MNQAHQLKRYILRGLIIIMLALQIMSAVRMLPLAPHFSVFIPIWFTLLIISRPDILMTPEFFVCLLCYLIHLIYEASGVYFGLNMKVIGTMYEIFYYMFYALSIFAYFRKEKDVEGFYLVVKILFYMIVITCITTFFALIINPSAVRTLASGSTTEDVRRVLFLFNIAGYDFIFGIGIMAPLFLIMYFRVKNIWYLALFFLMSIVVFMGQLMGAIIIYFVSTLMMFLVYKKPTLPNYLTKMAIIGVVGFFMNFIIIDALRFIGTEFTGFEQISVKSLEMANFLEGGEEVDEEDIENTAVYQKKLEISINGFLSSPYVGGAPSGGHHYWMDTLAENGIVGIIPWILFFVISYRVVGKYISKDFRLFYLHFMLVFISIGVSKNITISTMPIWIFFIIPAFLIKYNDEYNLAVNGSKK